MTISDASVWASEFMKKDIATSNISYLIQYGLVRKVNDDGITKVYEEDLEKYYSNQKNQKLEWKKDLGDDLNWDLSFDKLKESERTKHVHRLHPYKGKFIPQLVEYFLDYHVDNFKKEVFFKAGDVVLDPFSGSGTTLVQANELGIHAVGVDISEFNALISNVKVEKHNLFELQRQIQNITYALQSFVIDQSWGNFEAELLSELSKFNNTFFPSPEYKYKAKRGEINPEGYYSQAKEKEFVRVYNSLVTKHGIQIVQSDNETFLDKWFLYPVRQEIDIVLEKVQQIKDPNLRRIIMIILSRTIRTARATTHADLATLKEPVTQTYYCRKHYKICKPLFSLLEWWKRYSNDTVQRLIEFNKLRTNTYQICLVGDARTIDISSNLSEKSPQLAEIIQTQKIRGIFSSPPYIGLIDYHEQHAYAYEAFNFIRRDSEEIGAQFMGKSIRAKDDYIRGIANVLQNCKRFLCDDYHIFLVANDDSNLYPEIAKLAGMKVVNEYKRPVLNRTEKNRTAYSETIFHLKEKIE
jgi:DNA methylase